ncbi:MULTISPECIES: PepSY domain-containing protein [Rhodococcus]|uniref:PepSY domain-containing protein n=1 Tax=Rhodococcus TaxID=1827 RepID=UPI001AE2054F|nr:MULTISPECIES: PepSY domain-containing protein [Rhodococcus]MBP1160684.1 putative membrane protein YkoI [Rhodococcus sp. PvR099]MCZ4556429.1 PepSY domain-containing protein [Rhodococcus maanshanensis]
MNTRTVRGASLIPIAAAALLLAGCDSDSDDTSTTSATAAVTTAPVSTGMAPMGAVTKEQAEQTALATVPGGVVVSSETAQHDGKAVWHVHIRNTQGWDYDVDVDATTGAVVPDHEDDSEDMSTPAASPNAAVTVTKEQAEQTALATVPGGTIVSSETNQHDGKTVWHVHIRNTQGWDYDVDVDAATGAVVPDN